MHCASWTRLVLLSVGKGWNREQNHLARRRRRHYLVHRGILRPALSASASTALHSALAPARGPVDGVVPVWGAGRSLSRCEASRLLQSFHKLRGRSGAQRSTIQAQFSDLSEAGSHHSERPVAFLRCGLFACGPRGRSRSPEVLPPQLKPREQGEARAPARYGQAKF